MSGESSLRQLALSEGLEVPAVEEKRPTPVTLASASSLDVQAAEMSAALRVGGGSASGGGGRGRGGRYGGRGGRYGGRSGRGEVPVCKFFRQGRCAAGTSCRFRHTQEAAREGAMAQKGFNYSQANTVGGPSKGSAPTSLVVQPGSKPTEHFNEAAPSPAPPLVPRRPYCPISESVIVRAKAMQDLEGRPWAAIEGPFFSIDVECVASGYGHGTTSNNRLPARIALVDSDGTVLLDEIVSFKHQEHLIVSYLTPLTGLTKDLCTRQQNKSLDDILEQLKTILPKEAVLVGQAIHKDIDWLGLKQGTDFKTAIDISLIFRQRTPKNIQDIVQAINQGTIVLNTDITTPDNTDPNHNNPDQPDLSRATTEPTPDQQQEFPTRYRIFSLRHCCLHLLGTDIQTDVHDPVADAKYSLMLFLKYQHESVLSLRAARDALHRAPHTPSFASQHPLIDGVCLSKESYKYKHAARFIWKWWTSLFGGANALIPKIKMHQQT